MSVLVACRGLRGSADWTHTPVSQLRLRTAYDEALAAWNVKHPESWSAVLGWRGRSWHELVNGAVAEPAARAVLVHALGSLARACDEVAIWYAGFPDDLPVATTPEQFEAIVKEQLGEGELEPSARLVVDN